MDASATPSERPLWVKTGRRLGERAVGMTAPMEAEPLIPMARFFHQPGFNCCIVVIMGAGKPFDVNVLKSGLEATFVWQRHPRFCSIQGLTVHFQSYMNKMEIVLAADNEVIPDPHQFQDDFAESLQLIKGAIPSTL